MRIKKTSATTPVQAQVVNTYSTSTTDAYSANYVNNNIKDIYSSTASKTNKVWTNNKPIYRRVITGTTSASENSWSTIGSISNCDTLVSLTGIIGGYLPVPIYVTGSYYASLQKSGDNIQVLTKGYTSASIMVIAEFTKTTD